MKKVCFEKCSYCTLLLMVLVFAPIIGIAQQHYAMQDSITGYQTNNGYNSIIDGQPSTPKQPTFTITAAKIGTEYQYEGNVGLSPSNHGFFRNSLFSFVVPSLNVGEGITDLDKSVSGSWLQRWQYEHDGKPTISSMISFQLPYDQPGMKANYVATFILTKNIKHGGVGYFNAYVKTKKGFSAYSASYGGIFGYKLFLPKQKELLVDLLCQSDNGITIEASLEIDLPKGWTVSPGLNYGWNTKTGVFTFGGGLLIFCQTSKRIRK